MSDNTQVRQYWNSHIHDLDVSSSVPGSREFFADLDQYHFEKLHHLPRLIDFDAYRGKRVLDVGCGAGTDLARFAKGGALVSGVDLSLSAIALATQNFAQQGLAADLREADGEHLPFADGSFDFVFAHGVVQYTAHDKALVDECRRVLEHEDAPVLKRYSAAEFRALLTGFRDVRIVEERFPVRSRLHGGWKGTLFNTFFVGTFNALPRSWVRRFGWHLLAFCTK